MSVRFFQLVCLLILSFAFQQIVKADPIVLYTTGVANNGSLLAAGAVDTHYQYIAGGTAQSLYVVSSAPPAWAGNTGSAQWISLDPNGNKDHPNGMYTFRTTFTIDPAAGYNLSTAMITGSLRCDDRVKIFLNGQDTGIELPPGTGSGYIPGALSSFLIKTGFVLGTNTIDFVIANTPAAPTPIGLQVVTLNGSIDKGAVGQIPEPTTLLLLGTGLAGVATRLRRRKRQPTNNQ